MPSIVQSRAHLINVHLHIDQVNITYARRREKALSRLR